MLDRITSAATLILITAVVWLLGSVSTAEARGFDQFSISRGVGVSAHHPSEGDLRAMARAGIRIVRTDMSWDSTESAPGQYDWSHFLTLAKQITDLGMRPLFVLAYGNSLHASGIEREPNGESRPFAPATNSERIAFALYAAAAVKALKMYDPIWEIWNEPEHDGFWPPKSDSNAYIAMAERTCSAMRRADAEATIIGPAAARVPTDTNPAPELLVLISKAPLARCLDAISVHPYISSNKMDTTSWMWSQLRSIFSLQRSSDRKLLTISSEWGISTVLTKGDARAQAIYLAKMMVLNAANYVPVSIWYDWRDDGTDPTNNEQNFGLIAFDGAPKPALRALSTFADRIGKTKAACSRESSAGGLQVFVFSREGDDVWMAAWTNGEYFSRRHELSLPEGVVAKEAVDILGAPVLRNSPRHISIGSEPIYVRLSTDLNDSPATLCNKLAH